jgi:osmoprotectant transport system permease protein
MDLFGALGWLTDPANWQGPGGIPVRLEEHVLLSAASLLIAGLVAMPLGFAIGHTGRGVWLAVNSANAWRALPSLAVIGLLVPFTTRLDPQLGFTLYPTVIAMVVLAGPPLLVNSYAAVSSVDRDLVDAARGLGMRELQILIQVEIPNSLPVIMAGVRSATVQVIATATLGSIFAFGGLGFFLTEGIAVNDQAEIWGGVILVAALALASQGLLLLAERSLTSPGVARAAGGATGGAAGVAGEASVAEP